MVTETPNQLDQLLPDRHPQEDLFICDVADAVLKDVMPMMEHPFYSLSKKPETSIRRYGHGDHWVEIIPSVKGLATIYDKDILIYCISQIMHALKRGEKVSRRVRISSRDLLIFTNRGTAGKDYSALAEALDRLSGTRIKTNIKTDGEEQTDGFGLIDAHSIRRKHGQDGRLLWCEVVLSEWVFNAIRAQEVLTLHPSYFRLRRPLERRVYEIARKHCGGQDAWTVSLEILLKKSGSQSPMKRFRQLIKSLAEHDHLPDYHVYFDDERDMVRFDSRGTVNQIETQPALLLVSGLAIDKARQAAPGWCPHMLQQQWRDWMQGKEPPRDPDAAFVGFCKSWFAKRGAPR